MSTALTKIEPTTMAELMAFAKTAADSRFFGAKDAAQAMMIAMTGRDLGLSYAQSLRAFHVIEGKPSLTADGMVAVVLSRPDICEFFETVESDNDHCTCKTRRKGRVERALTFTMADAKAAELTGKAMWKKYPRNMLAARAKTALARDVYPDLLMGLYDPDELGSDAPVGPVTVVTQTPTRDSSRDVTMDASKVRAPEIVDPELVAEGTSHHPSWTKDRPRFCAQLGDMGVSYDDVAAFCAEASKSGKRPSAMTTEGRDKLLAALGNGGRAKFDAWLDARRERDAIQGEQEEEVL